MSDKEKSELRHAIENQLTVISLCAQRIERSASDEQRGHLSTIIQRCDVLTGMVISLR
jgi:hypothetical protein